MVFEYLTIRIPPLNGYSQVNLFSPINTDIYLLLFRILFFGASFARNITAHIKKLTIFTFLYDSFPLVVLLKVFFAGLLNKTKAVKSVGIILQWNRHNSIVLPNRLS